RRNRRRSKQPFILEESPVDTMADQRTMAKFLRAPTEGYAEAIMVPPILADQFELKHILINMMTTDQFFELEKDNPHDHIRCKVEQAAAKIGCLILKTPFTYLGSRVGGLMSRIQSWNDIIESMDLLSNQPSGNPTFSSHPELTLPEVNDDIVDPEGGNVLPKKLLDLDSTKDLHPPFQFDVESDLKEIEFLLHKDINSNLKDSIDQSNLANPANNFVDFMPDIAVTIATMAILKQFQATPPPASVKAVEEICVTCGGAHPYYQCLAVGGNTFPELGDNIQGYVLAAAVNYNQGNFVYRPPGMANQIRPPGFAQPNVQNNQNRFGQPQGFNRGNNFNREQSYQAPTQQNPLNELEKVKRINEANMKAMQTQINMVKNELRNEMKNLIQASLSNQTNEIKNMMASLLQMNTAFTSGSRSLPSNTVANPNGELKAITTLEMETLTDPNLSEYTIKVPPPPVKKYKPPSQREYVMHQRDPFHPNIPYPSRMLKQKQQEKDEKMLKALLFNKEKLQGLADTPLNENCSAVILKKLPKKLEDPGKFLISCGFSELKCKALADLGASINLMPLSVWKKLGLPELISTRMTLELANRAICTPAGIARDVFVLVGRFTFPADFVIVDYESDPRISLILARPFLRTARALIDVYGEEMFLHDDFLEDLFSNQPSGNPTFSSHPELTSSKVKDDIFDLEGGNVLPKKLLDLDSTKDLHPPLHDNPLSGSTTYSYSSNPLLEEFADELALITFPPKYDDDLQFDIESDLKEIEFLLYQDIDSSLKDSIDQSNLANLVDNFVDSMPEMFTDEHALDYSSPLIFDEYDDDFLEVESNTENVYDDPFDSNGEKIKESKLLIDELDIPCDFLPSEYDSFISQDFYRVDALPSTNNEDNVFNPGILIQEKPFEIITRVVQDKKLATSNVSLVLEDFDPPFYEPLFFKEVLRIPGNLKTHAEGFCPPVFISSTSLGNNVS
nr:hypothetical protein [Tanacetum cinerariifolium]